MILKTSLGSALRIIIMVILAFFVSNCGTPEEKIEAPTELKVSILSSESPEVLKIIYTPLLEHIQKQIGLKVTLVIPESYEQLLEMFHMGKVDVVDFGGMTFLLANIKSGAEPIVMRDIDLHIKSAFIALADASNTTIENFAGKHMSFGDKLSTSGHLMPRHFLETRGIFVDRFFSQVTYTGANDKTAFDVVAGKTDLGVLNNAILEKLIANGQIKKGILKVIWQTPTYANYVWAIQPKMNKELKAKIIDSFLMLSKNNPKEARILKALSAEYFIPARLEDFTSLHDIAIKQGFIIDNPPSEKKGTQ
jgi:phosphonate transport system substrate-binding protein